MRKDGAFEIRLYVMDLDFSIVEGRVVGKKFLCQRVCTMVDIFIRINYTTTLYIYYGILYRPLFCLIYIDFKSQFLLIDVFLKQRNLVDSWSIMTIEI